MKLRGAHTLKMLAVLTLIAAGAYSCGKNGKKSDPAPSTPSEEPSEDDLDGSQKAADKKKQDASAALIARAAIFKSTVHKHTRQYCVACHESSTAPAMAQSDEVAALKALEEGGKINYAKAARSRIVQRLAADNHNCWKSCADDAKVMEESLSEFITKAGEAGILPEPEVFKETARVALASGTETDGTPLEGIYVLTASMATTLTGPMTAKTDDKDGSIDSYLSTTTANQGQAVFTLNVLEAGTYAVWIKVKNAPNATQLAVAVDNGAATNWTSADAAMSFTWHGVTPTAPVAGQPAPAPATLTLQPGSHTVTVRGLQANVKFNSVALSKVVRNFQGAEVVGKVKTITVPLDQWAPGKNAKIIVEVSEFDAKSKTSQIRNLKVVSDQPIKIKDIRPLINGHWEAEWSTYRTINVDLPATPPGGTLIKREAQIVFGDGFASDKLSFTFGEVK